VVSAGHATSQDPQCALSCVRSAHEPSQSISPLLHWQTPLTHVFPPQSCPQPPQLGETVVSTHVPSQTMLFTGQ
jgi:hypothetical protein